MRVSENRKNINDNRKKHFVLKKGKTLEFVNTCDTIRQGLLITIRFEPPKYFCHKKTYLGEKNFAYW